MVYLQQWFSQHAITFTLVIAYIPLIATVVTTVLSIILARATLRYAESSDKSLALAREEFERQWSPELHVKLEKMSPRQTRIVVTNLGRISVLLQVLQLKRTAMGVPSMRTFLNEPLVGGMTWTEELGKQLFACVGNDYDGQLAACMTFYASGRLYKTDWFRFQVKIESGEVLRIDAVNLAARRVRVVDGGAKTRQELVKDVAAAAAAGRE